MRPDWVINRAAAAGPLGAPAGEWLEGISHTVLAKLQVARLQYQILERLGDSPEYDNGQLPPDRSLDVQVVLRNSLTDLDMRLGSTMDTSLKLSLIKPRLLLQVFTLQMPVDTISREERAFALLDCFAASSRVIAHVAEMDKSWVWPSTLSSVLFMAVVSFSLEVIWNYAWTYTNIAAVRPKDVPFTAHLSSGLLPHKSGRCSQSHI